MRKTCYYFYALRTIYEFKPIRKNYHISNPVRQNISSKTRDPGIFFRWQRDTYGLRRVKALDFFIRCFLIGWQPVCMDGKRKKTKGGREAMEYRDLFLYKWEKKESWVGRTSSRDREEGKAANERVVFEYLSLSLSFSFLFLFFFLGWIIQCRRALLDAPMYNPICTYIHGLVRCARNEIVC